VDWQQHWSAKSAEQRSFSFIEGPVIAAFGFKGCYVGVNDRWLGGFPPLDMAG
jgi:hypothetical protein